MMARQTHIDQVLVVTQFDVVENSCFVKVGESGHVLDAIDRGLVHRCDDLRAAHLLCMLKGLQEQDTVIRPRDEDTCTHNLGVVELQQRERNREQYARLRSLQLKNAFRSGLR